MKKYYKPRSTEGKRSLGSEGRKQMREQLGEFIRRARLAAGLSQEEMGERCGFTTKYNPVPRWESGGKPHVRPADVEKMVDVLRLEKDAFAPFMEIITPRTYRKTHDPSVGKHLKERLEQLKMFNIDLARDLDLYPQHVDGYVNGKSEPRLLHLKQIVDLLYPKTMKAEGVMHLLYGETLPSESRRATISRLQDRVKFLERENEELRQELLAGKHKVAQ